MARAPNFTLNYGLRYDYYAPLTEADNRIVKFNIDTGTLDPDTTPFYKSKKNNFQPRVGATFSPTTKTVIRGGFGIFVGPGPDRGSDSADRGRAHQHDGVERRPERLSGRLGDDPRELHSNPEQPLVPAARLRERLHAAGEGLPVHGLVSAGAPGQASAASVAYVGSQGRNLFLRSIANRTIGVQSERRSAVTQIREFDIVTRKRRRHARPTHPAAVRRNRLQDQRRPRQLQRACSWR